MARRVPVGPETDKAGKGLGLLQRLLRKGKSREEIYGVVVAYCARLGLAVPIERDEDQERSAKAHDAPTVTDPKDTVSGLLSLTAWLNRMRSGGAATIGKAAAKHADEVTKRAREAETDDVRDLPIEDFRQDTPDKGAHTKPAPSAKTGADGAGGGAGGRRANDITLAEALNRHDAPKSTLYAAAKKRPGEIGYLETWRKGRNVMVNPDTMTKWAAWHDKMREAKTLQDELDTEAKGVITKAGLRELAARSR